MMDTTIYYVRGPHVPQGSPPLIYETKSFNEAYGVMIKYRQLVKKKNIHIYINDQVEKVRVCRQCNVEIPSSLSGCLVHLNNFEIVPKSIRIKDFSGVEPK